MPITAQEMQRRRTLSYTNKKLDRPAQPRPTKPQALDAEISPREAAQLTTVLVRKIMDLPEECDREQAVASAEAAEHIYQHDPDQPYLQNLLAWHASALYILQKVESGYTLLPGDMKVIASLLRKGPNPNL